MWTLESRRFWVCSLRDVSMTVEVVPECRCSATSTKSNQVRCNLPVSRPAPANLTKPIGRTSSVGMELLGFTPDGIEVVPEGAPLPGTTIGGGAPGTSPDLAPQGSFPRKQQLSWEQISSKAAKIVSFADLAGHER